MTHAIELIVFSGATLITALVAGIFLAFSDFIIRSLGAASPAAGMEAMQQINRKVYSSVFLVWLLGMVPVSAGLAAYALVYVTGPAQGWFVAGGAIYVTGTFLVTILGNVPMNRRLDAMVPHAEGTLDYWDSYATYWTLWNHLRSIASAAAAAAFLIGCVLHA